MGLVISHTAKTANMEDNDKVARQLKNHSQDAETLALDESGSGRSGGSLEESDSISNMESAKPFSVRFCC